MVQGRKPEHSREHILEKGLDLFSERGYHGTGLNDILKACGVSKGSFYNFFGSKEQFAVEIIEHHHSIEFERWETESSKLSGRQFEKCKQMMKMEIERYESDANHKGCLITNLSGELGDASPAFKQAIQKSFKEVLVAIEEDLITSQREGDVRTDISAKQLAHLVLDTWHGALLRMQVESSTQPLQQAIDLLWNHILIAPQVSNPS